MSGTGAEGVGQDQEFPNFIHDFASSSRTRSRSATIPEAQDVELDVVASLRKGRGAAAVEARGSKVGEARPYPPSCLARKRRRPPGFGEAFSRRAALLPSLWLPFSCLLPSMAVPWLGCALRPQPCEAAAVAAAGAAARRRVEVMGRGSLGDGGGGAGLGTMGAVEAGCAGGFARVGFALARVRVGITKRLTTEERSPKIQDSHRMSNSMH